MIVYKVVMEASRGHQVGIVLTISHEAAVEIH